MIKNLSHHAYYLIGGDSLLIDLISSLEKDHDIQAQGNPDFFERSYQTFTIDDAREVKSSAGMRPMAAGGKKIFILTMNGITTEAQNALLKLLEEPADYAHFFLIIPSAHLLLPTVKSRMLRIGSAEDVVDGKLLELAKKFVVLSPAKRLEQVKSLLDEISKEKRPKQDAVDFLDALQGVIYKEKGAGSGFAALQLIEMARKYATDRAPSLKMLLEHVAINL